MKNAIRIFKRDMKNIFTNVVAAIIVVGLMIIPSLYSHAGIHMQAQVLQTLKSQ